MNALKKKALMLEPTVRIGKNCLSEAQLKEIKKQLAKRRTVKVKFLRAALEQKSRGELAAELVRKTGAELIQAAGFVVTLHRRK